MGSFRETVGKLALLTLGLVVGVLVLEVGLCVLGDLYLWRQTGRTTPAIRHDGEIRILCLGESTTAGLSTGPDQSYPRQLEMLLNASGEPGLFRVLNRGRPAINSDFIAARLPGYLEDFQPHIVVTMMGINDGSLSSPEFQVDEGWRIWKVIRLAWMRAVRAAKAPEPSLADMATSTLRNRESFDARLASLANRSDADALSERAEIQLALDDRPKAEGLARRALKASPNHAAALNVLGRVRQAQSREREGAELFQRALAVDPHRADAMLGLFELSLSRDPGAARRWATELVAKWPDDSRVQFTVYSNLARQALAGERASASASQPGPPGPNLVETTTTPLIDGYTALRAGERSRALDYFDLAWRSGEMTFIMRNSYASLMSRLIDDARLDESVELLDVALHSGHADDRIYAFCSSLERRGSDAVPREACGQLAAERRQNWFNPRTRRNYRKISRMVSEGNAVLIAVQYPNRSVAPLKSLLDDDRGVLFVDNEATFRRALEKVPSSEIFNDWFAGDFGHLTEEGNRMLARNVADAILSHAMLRFEATEPIQPIAR